MLESATLQTAFVYVVVAVAILALVVGLVAALRSPDAFSIEAGRFRIFHGEADTSPHQMSGTSFEDRHVIDPEARAAAAPGTNPVSSAAAENYGPLPRRAPDGARSRRP